MENARMIQLTEMLIYKKNGEIGYSAERCTQKCREHQNHLNIPLRLKQSLGFQKDISDISSNPNQSLRLEMDYFLNVIIR